MASWGERVFTFLFYFTRKAIYAFCTHNQRRVILKTFHMQLQEPQVQSGKVDGTSVK